MSRTKPYTLTGGPSAENVELSDRMFEDLYTDLAGATHNLLSDAVLDTLPASPVRGDLVVANATPKWARFAVGASNTVLRSTGSDPVWGKVVLTTDVTGTLPVTNGGTGLATVVQGDILYASAADTLSRLAKNTTATRYLSNTGASNNPAWSTVNLANGVSGILITDNGGTGLSSFAAGDIVASAGVSGTLSVIPITGSTNKVLRSTGTVSPPSYSNWQTPTSVVTGDVWYGSATNVLAALAIGATKQVLTVVAGIPAWSTPFKALFDHFTDSTVGGAEADIYTDTTAASTLATNGDKIVASYGGNFVTVGTELTQLKVYFAGTAIWDSTGVAPATGTTSWRVGVEIIRVSSSVIRFTVSLSNTTPSTYVYETVGELTGLTLSSTNILKITGTSTGVGSGSGDIVGKMGAVLFEPAA